MKRKPWKPSDSGSAIGTPVSIAFDGERAFFRSWHKAWKTKRLRHNPNVQVAPSTLAGRPTSAAEPARAQLLGTGDAKLAAKALAQRHRVLQPVLVPLTHRLMRYRTMHYELIPHDRCHGSGGASLVPE